MMTKIRLDFDADIMKILKKRFKVNIKSSTLNVTERLGLAVQEIIKIKQNYIEGISLLHIKK